MYRLFPSGIQLVDHLGGLLIPGRETNLLLLAGRSLRLHIENSIGRKPMLAEIAGIANFLKALLGIEIGEVLEHRHAGIIGR